MKALKKLDEQQQTFGWHSKKSSYKWQKINPKFATDQTYAGMTSNLNSGKLLQKSPMNLILNLFK